jgi:hypothetical protein
MRSFWRFIAVVGALAALAGAPAALAAGSSNPVADCNAHATLTHHYSVDQLRKALSSMPADIKEYTNCYDVIQRALLAQLGKSQPNSPNTSNSSSGDSFLPTPVIVVLVVLILAAVTFGAVALRRRRGAGGGDDQGAA